MLLPNADKALLQIEKLTEYCLSMNHPVGKNKAKVFKAVLGITHTDAEELRNIILSKVLTEECIEKNEDEFGKRYEVNFLLGKNNRKAEICTAWIVRVGEDFPG